jgi:hypothetical protein
MNGFIVIGKQALQQAPSLRFFDEDPVSLRRLIVPSNAMNRAPTGLVIPAWRCGFCRRIAASSVDLERGSPEMKRIPLSIKALADDEIPAPVVSCGPVGGNRA